MSAVQADIHGLLIVEATLHLLWQQNKSLCNVVAEAFLPQNHDISVSLASLFPPQGTPPYCGCRHFQCWAGRFVSSTEVEHSDGSATQARQAPN